MPHEDSGRRTSTSAHITLLRRLTRLIQDPAQLEALLWDVGCRGCLMPSGWHPRFTLFKLIIRPAALSMTDLLHCRRRRLPGYVDETHKQRLPYQYLNRNKGPARRRSTRSDVRIWSGGTRAPIVAASQR